jgi:hypothetical protein
MATCRPKLITELDDCSVHYIIHVSDSGCLLPTTTNILCRSVSFSRNTRTQQNTGMAV